MTCIDSCIAGILRMAYCHNMHFGKYPIIKQRKPKHSHGRHDLTKRLRVNMNMKNQKKPQETKSNGIAYGISIGMLVGVALGCWLDNLALWMCVGIAIGVGVGSAIDSAKSKKDK